MIKGWKLWTTAQYRQAHLIPEDDLKEHTADYANCWCCPEQRENHLYIHNSLDRREDYENSVS